MLLLSLLNIIFHCLLTHSLFFLLLFVGVCAPIPLKLDPDVVITAVFLDNNFLITGDNKGIITVHQLKDGSFVHFLNHKPKSNYSSSNSSTSPTSSSSHSSYPSTASEITTGLSLENRINCIYRTGRLVWIGAENNLIAVYDFYSSNSEPLAQIRLKNLAVKSVVVEQGVALFKVMRKPSSSSSNSSGKESKHHSKEKDKDKDGDENSGKTPCLILWKPALQMSNDLSKS